MKTQHCWAGLWRRRNPAAAAELLQPQPEEAPDNADLEPANAHEDPEIVNKEYILGANEAVIIEAKEAEEDEEFQWNDFVEAEEEDHGECNEDEEEEGKDDDDDDDDDTSAFTVHLLSSDAITVPGKQGEEAALVNWFANLYAEALNNGIRGEAIPAAGHAMDLAGAAVPRPTEPTGRRFRRQERGNEESSEEDAADEDGAGDSSCTSAGEHMIIAEFLQAVRHAVARHRPTCSPGEIDEFIRLQVRPQISDPPSGTKRPQELPFADDRFQQSMFQRQYVCDSCRCIVKFSSQKRVTGGRFACEFAGSYVEPGWGILPGAVLKQAYESRLIDCTWYCSQFCAAPTSGGAQQDRLTRPAVYRASRGR